MREGGRGAALNGKEFFFPNSVLKLAVLFALSDAVNQNSLYKEGKCYVDTVS